MDSDLNEWRDHQEDLANSWLCDNQEIPRGGNQMTMTRSDYQVVAETIKQLGGLQEHFESYEHLLEVMARSLASSLAITNPRFDEDKFLVACGVPTQKKEK